ncbi:MAG: lipopolysaccharide biosynthesis protein [Dehalococcoidia bacterium]|nr:MAG: lipopolysaccharide biosynthesis protein [Dehalococcoidia bacterium]
MNKQTPEVTEEQVIDLRSYLKILHKRRLLIILVTLLFLLTGGILSFFVLPPGYEAGTLLLVTQAADKQQVVNQGNDTGSVVNTVSRIPVLTMNTYVGQIKSEALLQRVIDKLQLGERGYTARTLAGQIRAATAKDSNLIEVIVSGSDPNLAADVANTLSSEFLELISEKNREQMERSVKFMQDQQAITEKDLSKAVEELRKFNSEPRGIAYLEQEFTARSQDLNRYQTELGQGRVEMQQMLAAKASLEESLAATQKTITTQKYDQLQGKVVRSEEINPAYTALTEKLNEKKMALAEKEAQMAAAQEVAAGLKNQVDQIQAELASKRAGQERLQAEVKRLEGTRNLLADKTTQTQIARSIDLGNTSLVVVSPAMAPVEPVRPKKKLNMAMAFVLGLMASVMLAFVLEYLDNTIKTPEDVARHLELPVLGTIPAAKQF